jgi:hypothetical protein
VCLLTLHLFVETLSIRIYVAHAFPTLLPLQVKLYTNIALQSSPSMTSKSPTISRAKPVERTISNRPQSVPPDTLAMNTVDIVFLQNNTKIHRILLPQPSTAPVVSWSNLNTAIRTQLLQTLQISAETIHAAAEIFGPPPPTSSSVDGVIIGDEPSEVRIAREAHIAAYEAHKAALQKAARAAAAQVVPVFLIEVHGAGGLRSVETEEAWEVLKREVRDSVWMLGYLKVLVRVVES